MVGMNGGDSGYGCLKECMEEEFNVYKEEGIESVVIGGNGEKEGKKGECGG